MKGEAKVGGITHTSEILPCSCEHAYQDERYGKGKRVHSLTKQNKPSAERKWRCSVCRREK